MGPQILFSPNSAFRARLARAIQMSAMGRLALCRRPIPAKAPIQPITEGEGCLMAYRNCFYPSITLTSTSLCPADGSGMIFPSMDLPSTASETVFPLPARSTEIR